MTFSVDRTPVSTNRPTISLVLTENFVKLCCVFWQICDFGLAKWKAFTQTQTIVLNQGESGGSSAHKRAGSVAHTPPEAWKDISKPRTVKYDVYSFAILLWELITEKVAFENGINTCNYHQLIVISIKQILFIELSLRFLRNRCSGDKLSNLICIKDEFSTLKRIVISQDLHECRYFLKAHQLTLQNSSHCFYIERFNVWKEPSFASGASKNNCPPLLTFWG